MQKNLLNILFVLIVLITVGIFAFESNIRDYLGGSDEFTVFDIDFYSLAGKKSRIEKGLRGYIVFYADMEGCQKCLSKVDDLRELSNIYEDIAYYAILKGEGSKESFIEFLDSHDMPGDYMMDAAKNLRNRYGLSMHPALLFFNREGKLMGALPYDVDHEGLRKTYHRYISEM